MLQPKEDGVPFILCSQLCGHMVSVTGICLQSFHEAASSTVSSDLSSSLANGPYQATIPITGTGIDPARSFRAAVILNQTKVWDELAFSFNSAVKAKRLQNRASEKEQRRLHVPVVL